MSCLGARLGGFMTSRLGLKKRNDSAGFTAAALWAVAIASLLSSGCTSYGGGYNSNWCDSFNHCSNECCTDQLFCGWRDYVWAKRAFYQRYPHCQRLHSAHFRRGFMAGYTAICAGEDEYTPAVPPEDYWGYKYQNAEGSQIVGAWFEGYPEGVKAATEDGAGMYRDIKVSAMLNAAMQPNTDAWADYTTGESEGQPPILTGQDMDMPPLPEQVAPLSEEGSPLGWHPTTGTTPGGSEEAAASNVPLSAQRRPFSWGLLR